MLITKTRLTGTNRYNKRSRTIGQRLSELYSLGLVYKDRELAGALTYLT